MYSLAGIAWNCRWWPATTGWVKDGDNSNYPLISGIGWRIRLIFHVLNKQRLRFDLVYRTPGYIFMYLGKSGISLRQASKKAKLARNSLMNSNKNVISYHWYSTFYMTLKWHFMTFCMQKWWKLIQNVMLNVTFLRLLIRLFLSNFAFFEACLKLIPLFPRYMHLYPRVLYTKSNLSLYLFNTWNMSLIRQPMPEISG